MFSSNHNSSPEELWSLLGTFYRNIPKDSKEGFEALWDALAETGEAAYYSLFQADLQAYIQEERGYYELLQNSFDIVFEDPKDQGRENTQKVYSDPENKTGLTHYLYKLPEDFNFLHIGTLERKSDGATLQEGTDFEILNTNILKIDATANQFTDLESDLQKDNFVAPRAYLVSPVISRFYMPTFGKDEVSSLFTLRRYNSKDPAYATETEKGKALLYGKHLKYFTWAYSYYLRKAPTLETLRALYGLVQDYPFAYQGGTVDDVSGSVITIGDEKYDVAPGTPSVTVGESVSQFDVLAQGITVEDYYSDPTLIGQKAPNADQPEFIIYLRSTISYNSDQDLKNSFKNISIPAGLKVVEELKGTGQISSAGSLNGIGSSP